MEPRVTVTSTSRRPSCESSCQYPIRGGTLLSAALKPIIRDFYAAIEVPEISQVGVRARVIVPWGSVITMLAIRLKE